jgi:hypothetical protein
VKGLARGIVIYVARLVLKINHSIGTEGKIGWRNLAPLHQIRTHRDLERAQSKAWIIIVIHPKLWLQMIFSPFELYKYT